MMLKRFLYLLISLSLFLCYSCKKDGDETLEGDPSDLVDDNHVKVDSRYGITAICPKGEWTNQYNDTCPEESRDYYKNHLFNRVALAYKGDTVTQTNGAVMFPTAVYLMRFHYVPTSQSDADEFMKGYKETCFDAFEDYYYVQGSISSFETTSLNGYEGKYFTAKMGVNVASGMQEIYLMYKNGRVYGVNLSYLDSFSTEVGIENARSIMKTISIIE